MSESDFIAPEMQLAPSRKAQIAKELREFILDRQWLFVGAIVVVWLIVSFAIAVVFYALVKGGVFIRPLSDEGQNIISMLLGGGIVVSWVAYKYDSKTVRASALAGGSFAAAFYGMIIAFALLVIRGLYGSMKGLFVRRPSPTHAARRRGVSPGRAALNAVNFGYRVVALFKHLIFLALNAGGVAGEIWFVRWQMKSVGFPPPDWMWAAIDLFFVYVVYCTFNSVLGNFATIWSLLFPERAKLHRDDHVLGDGDTASNEEAQTAAGGGRRPANDRGLFKM